MKSTKSKKVASQKANVVYSQGRIWDTDKLKEYREYQKEFAKKRYKQFCLRFDQTSEDDLALLLFLDSKENGTSYIKDLIYKDMEEKDALAKFTSRAKKVLKQKALESKSDKK